MGLLYRRPALRHHNPKLMIGVDFVNFWDREDEFLAFYFAIGREDNAFYGAFVFLGVGLIVAIDLD